MVREHETQRPDDVGCYAPQHLAFHQGFPDKAELAVLEVTQAAVDQLRGGGRRATREVILLAKKDAEAAARRIPRYAAAVDTAANDGEVIGGVQNVSPRTIEPFQPSPETHASHFSQADVLSITSQSIIQR